MWNRLKYPEDDEDDEELEIEDEKKLFETIERSSVNGRFGEVAKSSLTAHGQDWIQVRLGW
jgi:hypothetical protein